MTFPCFRTTLAIAAAALVAACGGGGSSAPANPTPPASTTTTLSGTAATGAPVANGSVSAQCASGASVSGSTDANGAWSLTLNDQKFPCLVTVSGGNLASGVSLHSVALDASALNVTPLTEIVSARAVAAAASEKPTDGSALKVTLDAALARVNASLAAAGYTPLSGNPFTSAFQPQEGDAHDDLIAKLMRSLADEEQSLAQLAAAFAASGSDAVAIPNTHVFKADELAAMPQLNKAALTTADNVLSLTLGTGSNSIGAFVGAGGGNKAVLQLPGLAGTKLQDLQEVTLDLSGAYQGSYAYMNFLVDLDCSAAPLLASATLNEVRARYRIFVFDPSADFIDNAIISPTALTKITFNKDNRGWKIIGSDPGNFGAGVLVNSPLVSKSTLTNFAYGAYPNACIADAASGDGGLFRAADADVACSPDPASGLQGTAPSSCGKKHTGALVVLGDSNTATPNEWKLKHVRIKSSQIKNFFF